MLTHERVVSVQGQAIWSPAWHDWAHAAPALRGDPVAAAGAPRRPAPTVLAANERRRAPDAVRMALQVAQDACAAAGVDPAALASVFTSAHGDLAIVDALCRTLAHNPLLLSPMRFHHSVHNAASGYWAIGCRSHEASTAVAGGAHSWAAGLLEALTQCRRRRAGRAAGGQRHRSDGAAAVGQPQPRAAGRSPGAGAGHRRRAAHRRGRCGTALARRAAVQRRGASPAVQCLADALPLFEALAQRQPARLTLPLSATLALQLQLDAA
jgi:hypothetical protein